MARKVKTGAIVRKERKRSGAARARAGGALRAEVRTRSGTTVTAELKLLADAELDLGAEVVRAFTEGLTAGLLPRGRR